MRVLIAVASKHGSTLEIAERIKTRLGDDGIRAELCGMDDAPDPSGFDAVILGSAVYMGNWMTEAREFVDRCQGTLSSRPFWIFSSGPLGSDPPTPQDDPQRTLDALDLVTAREHRIFSGRLDPAGLGLGERIITRMVKAPAGDFRDWDAIDDWASGIATVLRKELGDTIHTSSRVP